MFKRLSDQIWLVLRIVSALLFLSYLFCCVLALTIQLSDRPIIRRISGALLPLVFFAFTGTLDRLQLFDKRFSFWFVCIAALLGGGLLVWLLPGLR